MESRKRVKDLARCERLEVKVGETVEGGKFSKKKKKKKILSGCCGREMVRRGIFTQLPVTRRSVFNPQKVYSNALYCKVVYAAHRSGSELDNTADIQPSGLPSTVSGQQGDPGHHFPFFSLTFIELEIHTLTEELHPQRTMISS